jgi:hypothetical protein
MDIIASNGGTPLLTYEMFVVMAFHINQATSTIS